MKNELAEESKLIIYCDGPKNDATEEQRKKIEEVRNLVRERQWCQEVDIIASKDNKGLAPSVIAAVTEVVNKYGKIIVLEDDLVTSPYFLRFMNEGLNVYKNISNVYSINGFMAPITWPENESILIPFTSSWGWATWKDRWSVYDSRMPGKENIEQNSYLASRFNLADYDYTVMLNFGNNSWGIKWYFSVFTRNGLGVFPTKSLVHNIGFDGSGENCAARELISNLADSYISVTLQESINLKFYSEYLLYYQNVKVSYLRRAINKLKKILG